MKKILFIATGIVVLAVAVWYFFINEPTFNATDGYLDYLEIFIITVPTKPVSRSIEYCSVAFCK